MIRKILLFVPLLALSLLCTIGVQADDTMLTSDGIASSVLSYVEYDENNFPFINTVAMEENGIAPQYVELGEQTNEMFLEYKHKQLTKSDVVARMKRSFGPTYGNWCGLGQTMDDRNGQAIDALDWACKTHDLCYRDNGMFNADCDRHLIRQLKALIDHRVLSQAAHIYAMQAYAFFSVLRNYGG